MLKRAFLNQYNMILLGGTGLMAAASQHWLPLIVGAGVETLWLVLGSDAQFFHRWVNVQDGLQAEARRQKQFESAKAQLDQAHTERVAELESKRDDILELSRSTDQTHRDVLQPELDKMSALIESFVRLSAMLARLKAVRESSGEDKLQREISDTQREISALERKKKLNPQLRASLQTHLQLCNKRMLSIEDLRQQETAVQVQLDTIEQTFAYLKTNVANMAAPEAFAGEIDNVLSGIEAAEKTFARLQVLTR